MSSAAQVNTLSRGSTGSRSVANLQTKLTVGASRDSYEQEADRVAESVVGQISKPAASHVYVRGAQPTHHSRSAASAVPTISRLIHRTPTEPTGFGAEKTGGHPKEDEHQKVRRRSSKETERERKQEQLQKQEEETETQRKPQAGLEDKNERTNLTVKESPPEKEKQPQPVKRAEEHRPQTKAKSAEHDKKDEERTKVHRQEEGPDEPQSKLQLKEEAETQGKLQRQAEEDEETQSKAEALPGARDKQLFPQLDQVEKKLFDAKGGGVPLSEPARIPMEVGMGADFSRVRVHTGPTAVELSRALKAQAFTHGRDVFFNAGKYAPETIRGKLLLAHELTHVVQQQQAERKAPENTTAPHTPGPAPPIKAGTEKAATTEKRSRAEAPANIGPGPHRVTGDTPSIASGSSDKTVGPTTTAAVGSPAGTNMSTAGGPKVSSRVSPLEEEPADAVAKDVEPLPETESPPPGSKVEAVGEALPEEAVPSTKKAAPAVGLFLRRTSKPALEAKKTGIRALAGAQKTTDTAETKLAQTQKAVVPPVQESESRSRAGQVEKVDQAKAPIPSESEAKARFNSALAQAIPTTLEQVDQFKEEGKAQVVSQSVQGVVAADASEVNGVSIIWQLSSRAGKRIKYLPGDEDTNVLGTITFTLLEDLVLRSSSVRGPVWEDPVSEKGRRQLRAFRAFDRNVEEERVGLMCINGTLNDELFYLRQGNKSVFNIKANLNRYLRALKQSRGFCGWQNDFALRPSGLKTSAMIHYISQLFPRERFSEFKR